MPEPPPRRTAGEPSPPGEPPPTPPPSRPAKKKRRKKPGQRTVWTYLFFLVIAAIVGFGALQLAGSLFGDKEPAIGEHIHAALGVNICGNQVRNAPEFETRAGGNEKAGLHSHGDGLIHLHPFTDDEVGGNATVGLFFEYGGWELSEDRVALPGWAESIDVNNGDTCPDGRPGRVRWKVNGEEQEGNPADYAPEDGDVIAIAFIADGDAIADVPAEIVNDVLPNPSDVKQGG